MKEDSMSNLLGLLVFDNLNDVVYIRCNLKFIYHIQNLARNQGLIESSNGILKKEDSATESQADDKKNVNNEQECLDQNIVVQLFSPLVTSQRVMKGQFKNGYSSIECEDGTILLFQEFSGFLFLCIGTYPESYLQKFTNVSVHMIQLLVGYCVGILKYNKEKCKTLDNLLNAWIDLYSTEQSFLVEAIERLIVSPETSAIAVKALSTIVESVIKRKGVKSGHAIFFMRNRLLTLYSSKNADELVESDILALNLLTRSVALKASNTPCLNTNSSIDEALCSSPEIFSGEGEEWPEADDLQDDIETEEDEEEEEKDIKSKYPEEELSVTEFVLLLKSKSSPLSPHLVHVTSITNELTLVVVTEVNRSQFSSQLVEAFNVLEDLKNEECNYRDIPVIEIIDNSLRNAQDFLKWIPKADYPRVKKNLFQVCNRWESLKKNELEEWLRSPPGSELPSRTEMNISSLINYIRTTWTIACLEITFPSVSKVVETAALGAKISMNEFISSIESDAWQNTSQGSCSIISISKYLEEFPGLIHFLYIDRSTHQLTAPMLWSEHKKDSAGDLSEAANTIRRLTTAKIWSMVDFAREHLSKGHTSIIWKDKTFSYSYFLWFEDQGGNPLKPIPLDKDSFDEQPQPGILCGDFYKSFASKAFPDLPISRLRGFELFCIHLGMVTSPCILEQTRRLAATVWEIAGPTSTNPMDLL